MATVLIAYYSRSGHTARLAGVLADALRGLGHEVVTERIQAKRSWNKWLLPILLLPVLPFLPLYLGWAPFRRFWHRVYLQPEQGIRPLEYPDVADFDLVLLGTPKWLYIAFPVARWLNTIRGLEGRRVAPFATFCGPPLQVFELEMLFVPPEARIRARGATMVERLAVSSAYHPFFFVHEMESLFRWLSQKVFHRPLADFTLEGEIGRAEVRRFCDALQDLLEADVSGVRSATPARS